MLELPIDRGHARPQACDSTHARGSRLRGPALWDSGIAPVEAAVADLKAGLWNWRLWWILGVSDVRQRYRRSRLGQFWITISMALFVGSIGLVYGQLLHLPLATYLPHLAASYVVWTLISSIAVDSAGVFTQVAGVLRQEGYPRSIFVMRLLVRSYIAFAHNAVIGIAVILWFGKGPATSWLLVPLGLGLVGIAGFFAALGLSCLCTRFRDLPLIVQSAVQLLFFVSPVTWIADDPTSPLGRLAAINPIAALMETVVQPAMGTMPSIAVYAKAISFAAVLAALSIPIFIRCRARIPFWI